MGKVSKDRWADTRIERAAVLATERSIIEHTGFVTAQPATDHGIDLLVFKPEPFAVSPIQVKGAESGLKVMSKCARSPIILAYVVDPRGDDPLVSIMTGIDAWQLPLEYAREGGKASDYNPDGETYRWARVTTRLRGILELRRASEERWSQLFEEVGAK
ncbi:hypothetical protein [Brevibacterium casei]|uniref:hypothetical protein n=1 Tax=Brevibacterium casei TaxID=33889 RepID=UPI0013C3008E|nr:hypothetical protein [Brevibacterium casei]